MLHIYYIISQKQNWDKGVPWYTLCQFASESQTMTAYKVIKAARESQESQS